MLYIHPRNFTSVVTAKDDYIVTTDEFVFDFFCFYGSDVFILTAFTVLSRKILQYFSYS